MTNRTSVFLCTIGGLLLVSIGAVGSIGIWQFLSQLVTIPEIQPLVTLISSILYLLSAIASLGGFGVLIAAGLISKGRIISGKFVISLAAGATVISLLFQIIVLTYFWGIGPLLDYLIIGSQSAGWLGVVLSAVGRQIARPTE